MRALITGISGFIGRNLAEHLMYQGYTIVGADLRPRPKMDGIEEHYMVNLLDRGMVQAIVDEERPEVIIHLAAQVGRLFGEDDLRHTIESNAVMTTLVARAAGEAHIPLVYASTSEVYGDQGNELCVEDGPLKLSHNLYGVSKLWGEHTCQLYAPRELKILRLSMPYGPGVVPGRGRAALPNILWQAVTRQPIPVHRGSRRSWCWVGDTARAIRMIVESGEVGAFNVGRDNDEHSMVSLAHRACDMTEASLDLIQEIDPPAAQTVVKRLSTAKLESLGWKPEIGLAEGMRIVLDWVERFDRDGRLVS